jgi:conjugal transfer pilus assembly protein TraU
MASKIKTITFALVTVILLAGTAEADPSGDFFMPTEVGGANFFPFKVGAVMQFGGSDNGSPTNSDGGSQSPVRTCPNPGSVAGFFPCLDISFWSPDFAFEVVKTPYYSPSLGTSLGGTSNGHSYGGDNNQIVNSQAFNHTHWYKYPLMDVIGLMKNFQCLERGGVQLGYMSEIIPWKKDAQMGALMSPDSFLFANPIAIASCIPESASAQADLLIDTLWWCMGSWGTVYPLGNYVGISDHTTASAAMTGKALFEMMRGMGLKGTGALVDHDTAPYCAPATKTIWAKSHYKIQLVRPAKKNKAVVIGKSTLFWGAGTNPPYKAGNNSGDQFMYMIYQKYHCCEMLSF